jgi:isoquinoline 1-oxidoreductase beta subunit
MDAAVATSRRQFLKGSAAVGLVIAFDLPITRLVAAAASEEFAPNAFLRIAPDNTVTAISKHIEFGQGAYTGIATVLANELDAEWSQIRVESAPADLRRYVNLAYRTVQGTGGSNAMANSWDQLRQAGAQARALLVAAAAKQWKVTPDSITIERGVLKGAARRG